MASLRRLLLASTLPIGIVLACSGDVRFSASHACDIDDDCPRQSWCSDRRCVPCPVACAAGEPCPGGSCRAAGLFCQVLEGEAGALVAPMQLGNDPAASGGEFVFSDTEASGSASYSFAVPRAGSFVVQVRMLTQPPGAYCAGTFGACNSFYVGVDAESAQGDETHSFDSDVVGSFFWDTVSLAGSCAGPCVPEFDPMVWDFPAGQHRVTFWAREAYAQLDQVVLRECPDQGCAAIADFGCPAADGG